MSNDQSHHEPRQEVQLHIRDDFSILTFLGHLIQNQQDIITLKMSQENCELLKKLKGASKRAPYMEIQLSSSNIYSVTIQECHTEEVSFQVLKKV